MTKYNEAGKGSGRRKEDVKKIHDNWDLIFSNKGTKAVSQEIKEHEMIRDKEDPQDLSEDYERSEDDGYEICHHCSGSGEGMYDGSRCGFCKGTGEAPVERDCDDDFDIPMEDDYIDYN